VCILPYAHMYANTGLLLARIVMLMPMFIKTLFLALLFVSGSALAEWQFFDEGEGENKFFIERATVRKDGNVRTAWIKVEFKITNEDGVRSSRAKFEIDCKKETIRFLTEARFAEPNLKGKLVSDKDFPNSLPTLIAPETINSILMKMVCK